MRLYYDIDSLDERDPQAIERLMELIEPFTKIWFRPEVRGLQRVPTSGSLLVGNHNGGMLSADTFVFGIELAKARGIEALPYGLAHEVALMAPGVQHILVPLGAVRACHTNALRLFERGSNVLVYPGGDLEAMRAYSDRNRIIFGERRGYIKLALKAGVPITPIVAHGAHGTSLVLHDGKSLAKWLPIARLLRLKVWPLTFSLPWGFVLGITPPYFPLPTKITMEVLEPMTFERTGEEAANDADYVEACHLRVVGAMQSKLDELAGPHLPSRWRAPS